MSRIALALVAVAAAVACFNPVPQREDDAGTYPPDASAALDAGADADAGSAISPKGCLYIGGLDRMGFRGQVSDAGPCVMLLLISPGAVQDGGALELPPYWGVQSATAQDAGCAANWQGPELWSTEDVRGYVRWSHDGGVYPDTTSLDVTLHFDGGPGSVRMAGTDVPLEASCLP